MNHETATDGQLELKPTGLYIRPEFFTLGLHPNALLILAEIDQLSEKSGYCWPSNKHFRKRFELSDKTVARTIKVLLNGGHIHKNTDGELSVKTGELSINADKLSDDKLSEKHGELSAGNGNLSKNHGNLSPPSEQEEQEEEVKRNKGASGKPTLFDLPDWLPRETWDAFEEYREQLAKGRMKAAPLTARARTMAISHLDKLRMAGNDPVRVVERTVLSGKWTGFYELPESERRGASGSTFTPKHIAARNSVIVQHTADFDPEDIAAFIAENPEEAKRQGFL